MISKDSLLFLEQLSKNNNKEWFDINRKIYQNYRTEFIEFIQQWINELSHFDNEIENIEAKNCIFRINRDIRFSKNKQPYKTNFGAYISKGGKKSNYGGYYLHLEPNNCFFGAGIYETEPLELAKIRQEIDYNFKEFKTIVENQEFQKTFGTLNTENKLKKAPKGYEENNEAIEYLKLKNFIIGTKIDDKMICSSNFIQYLVELSKQSIPFIRFLNQAFD